MNTDDRRFDSITERIIGCAYKVGSHLGCGFLEKCYENALAHELAKEAQRIGANVHAHLEVLARRSELAGMRKVTAMKKKAEVLAAIDVVVLSRSA